MSTNENKPSPLEQDKYDPDVVLLKTSLLQHKLLNAVDQLDPDKVINNKDMFEQVVGLANGMNNTAVQIKKAKIEEDSSKHLGAIADIMLEKMQDKNMSTIRTVSPDKKAVTERVVNIDIDSVDCEEFNDDMLQKGLSTTDYDTFAEKNDLPRDE